MILPLDGTRHRTPYERSALPLRRLGLHHLHERRPVDHELNKRVIGIDPWELRGKPNIALASGGLHKVEVILAALRTGIYDTFISDQRTAEAIIRRLDSRSAPDSGVS